MLFDSAIDTDFNNENTNIRKGIATGMKHCGKLIETVFKVRELQHLRYRKEILFISSKN
jgi:hypothetical protein